MISQNFLHNAKEVGDFWILAILYAIKDKPKRFNQIKEELPDVTSRTLSIKLKNLVDKGYLTKLCPDNNRNFCEYSITEKGYVLKPLLEMLEKISIDNN